MHPLQVLDGGHALGALDGQDLAAVGDLGDAGAGARDRDRLEELRHLWFFVIIWKRYSTPRTMRGSNS